tara:strand:- start:67 stop:372 length:306 start_codon:yes stop_codon:yes gene_type:complete
MGKKRRALNNPSKFTVLHNILKGNNNTNEVVAPEPVVTKTVEKKVVPVLEKTETVEPVVEEVVKPVVKKTVAKKTKTSTTNTQQTKQTKAKTRRTRKVTKK